MLRSTLTEDIKLLFVISPFIWLFSGILFFSDSDKSIVAFVVLSLITILFNYRLTTVKVNLGNKELWLLFTMTSYAVFSYYYHGFSSREIRALLASTFFLLFLPKELLTKRLLIRLTLLGSFCALGSTYYFGEYLGLPRGGWPINAIPHATMSAAMAILALVQVLNSQKKIEQGILLASLLLATTALMFSQSRGLWLGFSVSAFIVLLIHTVRRKPPAYIFLVLAVCMVLVGYVAKPQIEQRIERTKLEVQRTNSGSLNNSISLRLQMYDISLDIIKQHPLVGSGDNHQDIFKTLYLDGKISEELFRFKPTHYHNQFFDRAIKNGVIGFLFLIGILLYPLLIVFRSASASGLSVVGLVVLYVVAGLTDVPLNHGQPLMMYLMLTFTLLDGRGWRS